MRVFKPAGVARAGLWDLLRDSAESLSVQKRIDEPV